MKRRGLRVTARLHATRGRRIEGVAVVERVDVVMASALNVRVAKEPTEPRGLPTVIAPSARNGPIASLAVKRRRLRRAHLARRVEAKGAAKDAATRETSPAEDVDRNQSMVSIPLMRWRPAKRSHAQSEPRAARDASREAKHELPRSM